MAKKTNADEVFSLRSLTLFSFLIYAWSLENLRFCCVLNVLQMRKIFSHSINVEGEFFIKFNCEVKAGEKKFEEKSELKGFSLKRCSNFLSV